jgi:hypothetical protein
VLPELAFEGWRPRHELEAKAVVDHDEPAGCEREALAVRTGDIAARGEGLNGRPVSAAIRLPRASTSRRRSVPIRFRAKTRPRAWPLGEPLVDELLGATRHGLTHLGAEADLAERHGIAGDCLTVEPGRAAGRDLSLDREVRTNGKCNAPPPLRIVERAQLDDGTEPAISGRIELGKSDILASGALAFFHPAPRLIWKSPYSTCNKTAAQLPEKSSSRPTLNFRF